MFRPPQQTFSSHSSLSSLYQRSSTLFRFSSPSQYQQYSRIFIFISLLLLSCLLSCINSQEFTLNPLEGRISSMQFINRRAVYVHTDKYVYLSADKGVHFQNFNQKAKNCQESKCIQTIARHPFDDNVFILISNLKKLLYICTDLNSVNDYDIDRINCVEKPFPNDDSNADGKPAPLITKIIFHPKIHNTLLVLMSNDRLYISETLASNFYFLKSGVKQISFANSESKLYSDTLLFGVKENDGVSYFFNMDTRSRNEDDNEIILHAREFMMYGPFLFVATIEEATEKYQREKYMAKLFVSTDNGRSFNRVTISQSTQNHIIEKSFVILDGSEGAVLINVQQEQSSVTSSKYGKVFISDARGVRYKETLWDNRRDGNHADFTKVKSLEGVYLANQVQTYGMNTMELYECNNCNGYEDCTKKCKTKTLITFDKSVWRYITPPKYGANKEIIGCPSGNCKLHLHGFSANSNYPRLHSHKDAVGIIFANGNVGEYLWEGGTVNTYMSRDGGLSWTEVAKGAHVYEILDHGGIMIIAENNRPTDTIRYSLDEADSWKTTNFTEQVGTYRINKIYANEKYDQLARYALIHGSADTSGDVIVRVDFSKIHQKECTGINNPYDQNSDYEYFKPHNYNTKCLLGRIVEYARRKRNAMCFNPSLSEGKPVKVTNCECTYFDYECDYGYEKKRVSDAKFECVAINAKLEEESKTPSLSSCQTENYYNESRGFARIPGNTCTAGLSSQLDPIKRDCPKSMSNWAVFIIVLFFVMVLTFGTLLFYKQSGFLQQLFNPNKMRYRYNQLINDMNTSDHSFGRDIERNHSTSFPDNRIQSDEEDDEDFGLDVIDEEEEAPEEMHPGTLYKN